MKLGLDQLLDFGDYQFNKHSESDGECVLAFGPITLPAVTRQAGVVTTSVNGVLEVTVPDTSEIASAVTLVWATTDEPYSNFLCGAPQVQNATTFLLDASATLYYGGTEVPTNGLPLDVWVVNALPKMIRGPAVNALINMTVAGSGVLWSAMCAVGHDEQYGIVGGIVGDASVAWLSEFRSESASGWNTYENVLLMLNWENAAITVKGGFIYDGVREYLAVPSV